MDWYIAARERILALYSWAYLQISINPLERKEEEKEYLHIYLCSGSVCTRAKQAITLNEQVPMNLSANFCFETQIISTRFTECFIVRL